MHDEPSVPPRGPFKNWWLLGKDDQHMGASTAVFLAKDLYDLVPGQCGKQFEH
jgi:hypothetical protein